MIALVTSTLCPSDKAHSFFKEHERYSQTIETVKKLSSKGFTEIFVFDNSSKRIDRDQFIKDSECELTFIQNAQYTFSNKGINEALLILNNLHHLPPDQPIFKISARYYPTNQFNPKITDLVAVDFIGKGYDFAKKKGLFSTRGYIVKNRDLIEKTLTLAIEDMMAYGKGIYGFRSTIHYLKSLFILQPGTPFQISMEHAFARILKAHNSYHIMEKIGIEGYIAGNDQMEFISE